MTQPRYLLDSSVLVDLLREDPRAIDYVRKSKVRPFVSTMVLAELYAGVSEGRERLELERLRDCWSSFRFS